MILEGWPAILKLEKAGNDRIGKAPEIRITQNTPERQYLNIHFKLGEKTMDTI